MQIIESTDFGVRAAVYRMNRRPAPLRFVLFPMVHVGRPEYYAEVKRQLREADVIIAEGVHPEEEPPEAEEATPWDLIKDAQGRAQLLGMMLTAGYRAIPLDQQHGLVVQPDDLEDVGAEVIRPDVSAEQLTQRIEKTVSPLRRAAGLALFGSAAIAQRLIGPRMTRYQLRHANLDDQPTAAEVLAPEAVEDFTRVIIDERDEPLLNAIDQLIETRGEQDLTVAVTYGARHLRAVINHLYDKGFRVKSSEWVTVTPWV